MFKANPDCIFHLPHRGPWVQVNRGRVGVDVNTPPIGVGVEVIVSPRDATTEQPLFHTASRTQNDEPRLAASGIYHPAAMPRAKKKRESPILMAGFDVRYRAK